MASVILWVVVVVKISNSEMDEALNMIFVRGSLRARKGGAWSHIFFSHLDLKF